ncbi:MAG: TauD/TfdA family dioxygenase [Actinomycetota bacterium]
MSLTIEPLTPAFGAEIGGIDVVDLSDAEFGELFEAFARFGVVFLRDQRPLTAEQHLAFARRFGEIHVHPAARGRPAEFPGRIELRTTEDSRVAAGNRWHSDVSCDALPPQASILQLHEIPPVGGDTLFASLSAAYDALSDRMKVLLDGLTALHSGEEAFRHLFRFQQTDPGGRWPEHDHPVVRRHPDSGRPVLFVDREFTKKINDLPKDEGRAILEFLFDHTERVDFQCRFRWSTDAIAIWDNRCVLHHALWDYWPAERQGHRISVVGEKPEMWRPDVHTVPPHPATVKLTA